MRSVSKKSVATFNESLQFKASLFQAKKGFEEKIMEIKLRQHIPKKKPLLLGKAAIDLAQFANKTETVKLELGNNIELELTVSSQLAAWKDKKLIK